MHQIRPTSHETDSHLAGQDISRFPLSKIHYCVRKIPLLVPILSQINPIQILTPVSLRFSVFLEKLIVFQPVKKYPPMQLIHSVSRFQKPVADLRSEQHKSIPAGWAVMMLAFCIIIRALLDSRRGQRIFPLSSVSRPALRPTQPPVLWVPGVKARPGRDADHSPLSSAEVKNE
jgi:hypothetical protein